MRTLARVTLAFLILTVSTSAFGQSVTEMVGKKFADGYVERDQQIVNGVKAVEEALKGMATNGETVRGGTGPLSSLLIESDTIICASWLMAFERAMTDMAVNGAFNSDAGAALFKAMQGLKNRVEVACQGVLNDNPPGNDGPREGDTTPQSPCPECEDEREAYQNAQYRLEHAQFEAERARRRADAAYELASTQPVLYRQMYLSTPQELERDQEAKEEALERAQRIRDSAHKAYLACLEACNNRNREQFGGFFDNNRNLYLVAAAAVVVATATIAGGGGGTPTAFVSTPTPGPAPIVVSTPTAPPPVTAPTPVPITPAGSWRCTACAPTSDADRHELTLQFCSQMTGTFVITLNSPLRITHPSPWVTLDGEYTESSQTYTGNGTGAVGRFPAVSARSTATFQQSGSAISSGQLIVTLGENGAFPGGRPVTYTLTIGKP